MRPWIVAFLVVILLGGGCASEALPFEPKPPVDDRKVIGLKGDVLSFIERAQKYRLDAQNEVQSHYISKEIVVEFDSKGQLKRNRNTDTEGHILSVFQEFDGDGRLSSKIVNRDGEVESETRFDYFNHGLIREKQVLNKDHEVSSKTNFQYDRNRYLVKVVNYYYHLTSGRKSEETVYKILYERDEAGTLLKEESYRNDKLEIVTEYQEGKRKRKLKYKPHEEDPAVEHYLYRTLMDSSWVVEPNGNVSSWRIQEYNESGDFLLRSDSSERGLFVMEYAYDGNGSVIREQYQGPEIVTDYSFSYRYDSLENWIRKDEYRGGIPYGYYTRSITYR